MRVERVTTITRTPRVMQVEGMFDVPAADRSVVEWDVNLPLDEKPWNIGLVVGPSGAGKSTVLREHWPAELDAKLHWPEGKSVLDGFPKAMGIKDIVAVLSSVGFSSPPAWLRPFDALSNGEQFRVTVARKIAEPGLAVIDEFTSVVDRTVAKIGSAAVAKAIRKQDRQLVAASCHYDVLEWLQPDWTFEPHLGLFTWRSVQPRPKLSVELVAAHYETWRAFRPHHYLSADLNKGAHLYIALVDGIEPAVLCACLPLPSGTAKDNWRISRLVTLPDFQGVGLGNGVAAHIGGVYKAVGKRMTITTSHPANVAHLARSPLWRMHRKPSRTSGVGEAWAKKRMESTAARDRNTAGFAYVGPSIETDLAKAIRARLYRPTSKR